MPDADGLGAPPAAIRAAAQWLVRLHSGEAGAADHAACARWRAEHPDHEAAWRKAERLARQFGAVPPALGVPVLTRQAGSRRAMLRTLAALGVAAPAAWLGWRHAPWQGWMADYATATGERREVQLADGSRLTLNTGSAVDVAWSGTQRLVRLRRGEVYVRTAPDIGTGSDPRPFIVETPQGRLRALGTRFTVRLLDEDTTGLTVQEHRVQVEPRGGATPLVVPQGQGLNFTATHIGATQPNDGAAPGWLDGVLYADGMRLGDFLAELSRYRPGVIRCAPEVAGLRLSGAFQLGDTDYVLALLSETLPVQLRLRTRWWVEVMPRGAG